MRHDLYTWTGQSMGTVCLGSVAASVSYSKDSPRISVRELIILTDRLHRAAVTSGKCWVSALKREFYFRGNRDSQKILMNSSGWKI
jgi:hypothetical protein